MNQILKIEMSKEDIRILHKNYKKKMLNNESNIE